MSRTASEDYSDLALAVYLEELARGKVVLFVGESGEGPERLAQGASRLDLVGPEARARGTRRGGRLNARAWPDEEEAGLWDLIVVPDLHTVGLSEATGLAEVARWVGDRGLLVAGHREVGGAGVRPEYDDFERSLREAFGTVRMLGQAPFHGWALVDFTPTSKELEVTFDGSLVSSAQRAHRYFAVCGERADVVLDAYTVVQVPSRPVAARPTLRTRTRTAPRESPDRAESELLRARADLQLELERAKDAQLELERAKDAQLERAKDAQLELERKLAAARQELTLANAQEPIPDDEYVRLETALRERGQELTELRSEVDRRGTLVRDLVEELKEYQRRTQNGAPAPPMPALRRESTKPPFGGADGLVVSPTRGLPDPEIAAEQAATLEAEKAEMSFRMDETLGELNMVKQSLVEMEDSARTTEATLRGTVRGLNARLAEVTEVYHLTQARLDLLEDDRRTAHGRIVELQRELAETRDQMEIEIARAHAVQAERASEESGRESEQLQAASRRAAEREGELLAALAKATEEAREARGALSQTETTRREAEKQLSTRDEKEEGMRLGYERRLAELVADLSAASEGLNRAESLRSELGTKLERVERVLATAQGESTGLRMRLSDREVALKQSQVRPATMAPPGPGVEDADGLRADLETARAEAEHLSREVEQLTERLYAATHGDAATPQPAEVTQSRPPDHSALIARLQSELAEAEVRYRGARAQLGDAKEAVASARAVSDVKVDESSRELQELTGTLAQVKASRDAHQTALVDARKMLEELVTQIGEGGDLPIGLGAEASGRDAGETRRLRERVAKLDAQARDGEVMLRSLTAQLQERDDRIRALERLGDGERPNDDDVGVLSRRLLEMEERVSRLTAELEGEREARRRAERAVGTPGP